MKLDIYFLFFLGCFIQMSNGKEKDKSVNVTSAQGTLQERSEQHTIHKKSPEKPQRVEQPNKKENKKKEEKEKEEIIIHNHGDDNYYESEATKYKPSTYDFDKEYNDDTFEKFLKEFKDNLEKPDDDDGFKTSKTVHTEHFEVKELNPKASTPEERYIIRGGYKVQEADPFDSKNKKTHLHTYDSPLSKIAASIYSKFDYLNFPHTSKNDDEAESEEEKEEASDNDNNESFYGNDFPSFENDDDDDNNQKSHDYSTYPSNEQQNSDDKDETRTMELYSYPSDLDDIYSKDWKKYILQVVYGDFDDDDYSAPSSIIETRVRAKRKV